MSVKRGRLTLGALTRAAWDGRTRCVVTGKVRLPTESAARAALAVARQGERRAYWCSRCGDWHLTRREG